MFTYITRNEDCLPPYTECYKNKCQSMNFALMTIDNKEYETNITKKGLDLLIGTAYNLLDFQQSCHIRGSRASIFKQTFGKLNYSTINPSITTYIINQSFLCLTPLDPCLHQWLLEI